MPMSYSGFSSNARTCSGNAAALRTAKVPLVGEITPVLLNLGVDLVPLMVSHMRALASTLESAFVAKVPLVVVGNSHCARMPVLGCMVASVSLGRTVSSSITRTLPILPRNHVTSSARSTSASGISRDSGSPRPVCDSYTKSVSSSREMVPPPADPTSHHSVEFVAMPSQSISYHPMPADAAETHRSFAALDALSGSTLPRLIW